MKSILLIKEIIDFLEKRHYEFTFIGSQDDEIKGFSTLFNYKEETLTFVSSLNDFKDYEHNFKKGEIKLIITSAEEDVFPCFTNIIQIDKPKSIFFAILEAFFDEGEYHPEQAITSKQEIYRTRSFISEQATIGKNVKIGIGCIIEDNVVIGSDTEIHHNVTIRKGTEIGDNCTILSGTVIGETGFNPLKEVDGSRRIIKHFGGITIGNDVHIGDNCSISRGSIDDTIINSGVKLNKQVIIAHNVVVGFQTVFTAPTFVCGSVIIGSNCHIAATTIRNQCRIGNNAILGLGSVVVKDVDENTIVVGNPAKPIRK